MSKKPKTPATDAADDETQSPPTAPTNPKLAAIVSEAQEKFGSLVAEAEDNLLQAWNDAEEEAEANEAKPKFRFSFTITLDLDADKMECKLSFGVRHSLTTEQAIPDPEQVKFVFSASGAE